MIVCQYKEHPYGGYWDGAKGPNRFALLKRDRTLNTNFLNTPREQGYDWAAKGSIWISSFRLELVYD